VETAHHP
jgi:hypothetical protein